MCGGATLSRPSETERVVPGLADRARSGVLGPGRRALARESVVRVQAEQAAIAVDPAVSSPISDGVHSVRPGRAPQRDRRRVRSRRTDAERVGQLGSQVARVGLAQRVAPEARGRHRARRERRARRAAARWSGTRPARSTRRASRRRRRAPGGRPRASRVGSSQRRRSSSPDVVVRGGGDPDRLAGRPGASSRKTKTCSQSASWSLAPSNVER